jgi:hypothetical protein
MSDVKISELPPYVGPNNPVGDVPISISGTTFKISPDKFSIPGQIVFPIMAVTAKLLVKGIQDVGGSPGKNSNMDIFEKNDVYLMMSDSGDVGLWQYVGYGDPTDVSIQTQVLTTTVNIL